MLKTVGVCIYCGATEPEARLTNEHIIPRSLGGTMVLPKASCRGCADIISRLEGYVARRVFQDVRVEHGYPYRNSSTRPVELPLCETFAPSPEKAPTRLVPVKDYPGVLVLINHEPAGILLARAPGAETKVIPFVRQIAGDDRVKSLKARGIRALHYRELKPDLFARFISKVALGIAVVSHGLDGFETPSQM